MSLFKAVTPTNSITMRWAPKNIIPPVASRYLNAPSHPIRPKIVHLCGHRDRNTLWWRVSVAQIQQHKRVVRSWCARRVRVAIEQALKQHGLDTFGKSLNSESAPGRTSVTGTLDVLIQPPCMAQKMDSLQEDANNLVSSFLEHEAAHRVNEQQPKSKSKSKAKTRK
ncbi:hypothetical protein PENANT_c015G10315 [Penicillium antarcticum]|uniref:Uncharacterized protein n=1 Tax=Penicillium antarcticum TaxID=416450 RepID=A0A1V6Q449_9EURO|nr:uncharacterized protein N7508_004784 [Penicillium antarcticum]KAJ5305769.1 hypothetical protein N7508_004784 [Penicillium antarcticum]OQD83797.1 hypothetical protein PENANT_c015G10315 [Penicillium antarcticum]